MLVSNFGDDYKLLKVSDGKKLESWGKVKLLRPDPVVIWNNMDLTSSEADAVYYRSSTGGGHWENNNNRVPSRWTVNYKNLTFNIKQMGFKHTGLFPEQSVNWDRMIEAIRGKDGIKVLNLFAYTGGATVACLSAGASVVHVDSSRGMNDWAKENVVSSGLADCPVRFLVDDVVKFVEREIRRGNKYDAIIMDPPSYGRGANKELWTIEKNLDYLLKITRQILKDDYLFVCVNTYSSNLSLVALEDILKIHFDGNIQTDEICIPVENTNLYLPCGITGWITR